MSKLKIICVVFVFLLIVWVIIFRLDFSRADHEPQIYGAQFTKAYAEFLGLDWKRTYLALLDDLGVDHLRLAAFWNELERERGQVNFSDLDWLMKEAMKREVKVILVVGRRLPRWPECHVPGWAGNLPLAEQEKALADFVSQTINRYRGYENLEFWQVENEPFLTVFGECPKLDQEFVRREIALVKELDPAHKILITDSGELSSWRKTAQLGDLFGTTMYRIVWNQYVGYWNYNWILPPAFYRLKAQLVGKSRDQVLVSELQAEPWIPNGAVLGVPLAEQFRSMNPERFEQNINFARRTGFSRVYLWGAEWWYWLKEKGEDGMWQAARALWPQDKVNMK